MSGLPIGGAKLVRWVKDNGQRTKWHGLSVHHKKLGMDVLTYCGRRTHETDTVIIVSNKHDTSGGLEAICGKCFDI